jgi:hypothetical protein
MLSVDTHLNTISSLIDLDKHQNSQPHFPTIILSPANKSIEPQKPFQRTRKRPRQAVTRIAKPSQEEKTNIVSSLCNNKPLYCTRAEIISKT